MTEKADKNYQIPDDVLNKLGDRYSQFEYLSSGATSAVFKAHDNILGIYVAIKILKRTEEKDLVRFQKEAKTLSQVKHKNLVQILDFNVTSQNHAYLIMEFIEGVDLASLLKLLRYLTVETSLDITSQICQALSHAHSKNVIHRDLKSSNIIINDIEDPHVTVVDFGLATQRSVDDRTTAKIADQDTTEGRIVGSPLYMSPEQAQGKKTDQRTDIYSLGCILFELLTGQTPFNSDESISLLNMHIKDAPPTLAQVRPQTEFPLLLENIVAKMLAKQTDDRFYDMQEILDAIAQIYDEDVGEEQVKTNASIASNKRFVLTGLVIFTIVVGAIYGVTTISSNRSSKDLKTEKTGKKYTKPKSSLEALMERNPRVKAIEENFQPKLSQFQEDNSRTLWYCLDEFGRFKLEDNDLEFLPIIIESQIKKDNLKKKQLEEEVEKAKRVVEESRLKYGNPPKEKLQEYKELLNKLNRQTRTNFGRFERLCLAGSSITGEGLKYLATSNIKRLDLSNTHLDTNAYSILAKFDKLDNLTLNNSTVTDDQLNKLWNLKNLRFIRLDNCSKISKDGFADIEKCETLQKISIRQIDSGKKGSALNDGTLNREIDDGVLVCLAKSPRLSKFYLDRAAITDSGIKSLLATRARKGNKVIELDMNGCKNITGDSLKLLAEYNPEIKYLGIGFTKITKEDLKVLSNFKDLRRLFLIGIEIDEKEMKLLGNLKNLKWLYLGKVTSGDESLKYLYGLENLEALTFVETPAMTVNELKKLRKHMKKKFKHCVFINPNLKHSGFIDIDSSKVIDLIKFD